jgi:predicted ATP-dependent endonuclease of OLD family
MLTKLKLENYRCFDSHQIEFKDIAIIVGKNNAGKSTIIEALRLVSIVSTRNLNFQPPPKWLDLTAGIKGVTPSLSGLGFSMKNIFHKYQDAPAKITAIFQNKSKIEIYIGEKAEVFAIIYDKKGNVRTSKQAAKSAEITTINILPQISALAAEENVLGYEYVKANLSTHLSSLHFRNQIKYFYSDFQDFKLLAESSWPGLGINELDGRSLFKGSLLTLIVRDQDFAAEIGWMGHGLQMWLQTMWFLSRADLKSTVILDEPDVYMHADLQRKLIRLLKHKYNQVLLATHSIEIISEVEPENILVVDKSSKKSNYTTNLPAVQSIVNSIGSIQNIGLARLWSAKKLLLVEGKDVTILKRIQDTIYSENCEPFDIIPRSSIGGWSGWNLVKGADFILKNGLKQDINVFCLLDSDYHLADEQSKRKDEAKEIGINLHIWDKKEIENYLLSPQAMHRILMKKGVSSEICSIELIDEKLNEIAEKMKDDVIASYTSEFQNENRKIQAGTAFKKAKELVDKGWNDKLSLISGKVVITELNKWFNNEFKESLSLNYLAQEIRIDELDSEFINVIKHIEKNESFE